MALYKRIEQFKSTKPEARNPKQTQNPNVRMIKMIRTLEF